MAPVSSIPGIRIVAETLAGPEVAWSRLTDPARVVEWLTDATPVGVPGDRYSLDFGDGSVVEGRILEVTPGRRFSHSWAWAGEAPAQLTRVTWTIEPRPGGGSRIVLEHDGWAETGADLETRDDHAGYWEGYVSDLAALLDETAGV